MWPFKKRPDPLTRIVEILQSEEAMIIEDLAQQVEQKLQEMPEEEALKVIARLKGEPTR